MPGFDGAGEGVLAGRYELKEVLGRGGMATVYRAWDAKLERDVAVKVFVDDTISGEQERQDRREREMRLLARAAHPHLVTLFDAEWATDASGAGFLVMELVRGDSLRRRLEASGADAALAAQLAREVGEALAYLHAEGIVHRDLKPENILLAQRAEGEVSAKLVDFGIAQLLGERITVDGSLLGTAAYLSPEQVAEGTAGPPSDVYALGLVLIETLTGERVFPGSAVESALARLSRDPAPPAGLPREWRELVAGMTARDPAARPAAAEVARRAAELPAAPLAAAPLAAEAGLPADPRAVDADPTAALTMTVAATLPATLPMPAPATTPLGAAPPPDAGAPIATAQAPIAETTALDAVTRTPIVETGARDAVTARSPRRRRRVAALVAAGAALAAASVAGVAALNAGNAPQAPAGPASATASPHPVKTTAPPAKPQQVQRAPVPSSTPTKPDKGAQQKIEQQRKKEEQQKRLAEKRREQQQKQQQHKQKPPHTPAPSPSATP